MQIDSRHSNTWEFFSASGMAFKADLATIVVDDELMDGEVGPVSLARYRPAIIIPKISLVCISWLLWRLLCLKHSLPVVVLLV